MVVRDFGPFEEVLDIGCGVGTWLKSASDLGARRVGGIEGEWARENEFQVPNDQIEMIDLEQTWKIREPFDLAMCLEVAEHLTEPSGQRLVENLRGKARVVLF